MPEVRAAHLPLSEFHPTSVDISLKAVAFASLFVSALLWVFVAIATPLPGFLSGILRRRISPDRLPANLRDRIMKNHA